MNLGTIARQRWDKRECGRLFHGVAEGYPGVTIDRYGSICLVQTWETAFTKDEFSAQNFPGQPVFVPRGSDRPWSGPASDTIFEEVGIKYRFTTPKPGKDPVLFLDFRCGRRWLRQHAHGDVLNTFAYTCGAGLAAAANGARVLNLDHGQRCIQQGIEHAKLNALDMEFLREDFYCAVRQFAGLKLRHRRGMRRYKQRDFDLIVLDPPTRTHGPYGSVDILRDYPALVKPCILALKPKGTLLATHHHPAINHDDWTSQVLRCAEKAGRPISTIHRLHIDDDFPSFDGHPPLKVAVFQLA